jgi:hypothetical protein
MWRWLARVATATSSTKRMQLIRRPVDWFRFFIRGVTNGTSILRGALIFYTSLA